MHYLIFKVNYNVLNCNRLASKMEDSYIHQGLRKKLIEKLVYRGIRDEKVLSSNYFDRNIHYCSYSCFIIFNQLPRFSVG